jgi:hypothetical protein
MDTHCFISVATSHCHWVFRRPFMRYKFQIASSTTNCVSRSSSVSIVSDYGLDNRAMGVRSPAGAKDFSSILCVQTGSGAHPASCPMGTWVLSPGLKRGRGVTLTTPPHLVPRSGMSRSHTSSPPSASVACSDTALLYN